MEDAQALDGALIALFWVGVGVAFTTVAVAWLLSWFAARPRGVAAFWLVFGVLVSVELGGLVIWAAFNGDATLYDFVWLAGAVVAGSWCAIRLVHRRRAASDRFEPAPSHEISRMVHITGRRSSR
jgi:hypothetical protein